MNASEDPQTPKPGYMVDTACGSQVEFAPDATFVVFHGEVVYFCCSECKQDYKSNPRTSCLAGRLATG